MTTNGIKLFSKKIKMIYAKVEQHNLLTAISINIIFLILVLIFCETKYETSDDYIMAAIMSGAYNVSPNPHMIFINILWGYFLLPFYNFIPHISWYLISQLFLCYCSFTAITYILLKRLDTMMGVMISILFITLFSDDAYIMVQFTKTAILAVMAGSILFLYSIFHRELYWKKQLVIGAVLAFGGSLIRFNVIYIAGGFLIIIIALELIRILLLKRENSWKWLGQSIIIGSILIGAVIGAKKLDTFIYNSNEEYAFFREYGKVRGNIVDKMDYGYEVCEEKYRSIGISENDYLMLRKWNFGDPDFYTLEQMKKVQKIVSDYEASLDLDRDAIKNILRYRNYWAYPSLLACVLLAFLSIIFNKRYWWCSLLAGGLGYLYLYYFVYSGKIVYRIEYGVFLCVFLTIIYFWDKTYCRIFKNKLEICNICVILIALLVLYQAPTYRLNRWAEFIYGQEYKDYVEDNFYNSWDYDSRRYRCSVYNTDAYMELQNEVVSNPRNFYFLNFHTAIQTLYLAFNPMWDEQKYMWENVSYLGSVTVNHPDDLSVLKQGNIENPLKDLVNDNVYLIDNFYYEETLKYIQEHYYSKARMELYKTVDGFKIWKFYKD